MITIQSICRCLEDSYPLAWAESWDNPGLCLGRRSSSVKRVLLALELTRDLVDEAIAKKVELIVTHHPFIFKAMKAINDASPEGQMLLDLAEHKIGLYAAHTNLDVAPNGIANLLAQKLGIKSHRPLIEQRVDKALKLVCFVPSTHSQALLDALHEAGAGKIGNYSECSFRAVGKGHFTPADAANPTIGNPGAQECVDEERVEVILPRSIYSDVRRALLAAHPYEEPAYDLYALENEVPGIDDRLGFGCIGLLPKAVSYETFIATLKDVWELDHVCASPCDKTSVQSIALLNGSGAKFLANAKAAGADVYITGDCHHHAYDEAMRLGIGLIDAGHYGSEKWIPSLIRETLENNAQMQGLELIMADAMRNPMHYR